MPPVELTIATPELSDRGTLSGTAGLGDLVLDNLIDPNPTARWRPSGFGVSPASVQLQNPPSELLGDWNFIALLGTNAVATTKNLVSYGQDLPDATWVKTNATVVGNANGFREDLNNTVWFEFQDDATNAVHNFEQTREWFADIPFSTGTATRLSASVLIREDPINPPAAGQEVFIELEEGGTGDSARHEVTIAAVPTVGTSSTTGSAFTVASIAVIPVGPTTYLMTLEVDFDPTDTLGGATGDLTLRVGLRVGGSDSYAGTGTGLLVALAKLELGSPTTLRELNEEAAAGIARFRAFSGAPSTESITEVTYLANFLTERNDGVVVGAQPVHCWFFQEDLEAIGLPTQVNSLPTIDIIDSNNPAGFFEASRIYVDNALIVDITVQPNWGGGKVEPVRQQESRIGGRFRRRFPRKGQLEFFLDHQTEEIAWERMHRIDQERGVSGDVFVIPCPSSAVAHQQSVHGFIGRSTLIRQPIFDRYSKRYTIVAL